MATNWVKDGLDAYLALTGEKRAQDKADADLADRKHSQSIQDQSLVLAQNQDARSATSAGLSNQVAQLNIDEGTRKAADKTKFSAGLRDFVTMKAGADPSIPNVNDPVAIAAARQGALDLAHTGAMLNNIPPGAGEFTLDQLPASAQKVLMEGPGKAAGLRTGTVHTDPATGGKYTMTGQMGKIRYVREEGKPAIVIPTMLAQNEDGTMREVPYTDGTNNPNAPVKHVTAEMMNMRAGATLSALDQAEKTGISPTVAYAENMYQMLSIMPEEQQAAWMAGELNKLSTRRDKHISDAETTAAAAPYSAKIEELKGTPAEKRKAATALLLGAPSSVVDHLMKTSKSIHDMFPDAKKTFTSVETANGVFMVDATDPTNKVRIGGLKPTAAAAGGGLPSDAKMIEYYKGLGYPVEQAVQMVGAAKENPSKLILDTFNHLKTGQKDMGPGDKDYKTDDELIVQAEKFVSKYLVKTGATTAPTPAARGMSGTQADNVSGAAALMGGGSNKPSSVNTGSQLNNALLLPH